MYSKLPRVRYITPQGFKDVSDITTTFRIQQTAIDEGEYPINVYVPETDRPEVFAHRMYGDSNLHWALLNINNKINPYYDWVLSPSSFENLINEKYPGYTLFLVDVSNPEAFAGSFRTNDIVFSTGITNDQLQPSVASSLKNARVVSYDPAYCRLVIEFTQKTAWVPVVGEFIAGKNSDKLGESTYYVARIGKVIETPYAVHHFETPKGNPINQLLPGSLHAKFITPDDMGFTFGSTILGRYILYNYNKSNVINRDYEISINDNNRSITMISKSYLLNITRDMENLLSNG